MLKISVPAQLWHNYADKIALIQLTNQKKDELISVPAFEFGGFLHMAFGALYTPMGAEQSPIVYACRLLPPELYTGVTTTKYHDEESIANGTRKRGDHTGLMVSVNRKRMVCAQTCHFVSTLPTTLPLSLAQAQKADSGLRDMGWRAFFAKGIEPTWSLLHGHPVASYVRQERDIDISVLYWKHKDSIMELKLDGSYRLEEGSASQPTELQLNATHDQLDLFSL